ncbi:MAG: VOC family protein [Nitrospinota bacterium]
MAKLRHIAVATRDPQTTAEFYKKHFEMREVGTIDNDLGEGVYLSDGVVNLAVLKIRSPWTNRPQEDVNFTGIHHFGFIVEDIQRSAEALKQGGSEEVAGQYRGRGEDTVFYERKFLAPDDVVIDISEGGWAGANKEV